MVEGAVVHDDDPDVEVPRGGAGVTGHEPDRLAAFLQADVHVGALLPPPAGEVVPTDGDAHVPIVAPRAFSLRRAGRRRAPANP